MAAFFLLEPGEFDIIRFTNGYQPIMGFNDVDTEKRDEYYQELINQCVQKGYIIKSEENGIRVIDDLRILLKIAEDAFTGVLVRGDDFQEGIYFFQDSIAIILKTGSEVELISVPYLPLAIGQLAGRLEPYLNSETERIGEYPQEKLDEIRNSFIAEGYHQKWEFSAFCGEELLGGKRRYLFEKDGKEQVLFAFEEDHFFVIKPDKADCINELTRVFAPLHGQAIGMGGTLS